MWRRRHGAQGPPPLLMLLLLTATAQAGLGIGRHRGQLTLPVVRLEEVWRRAQCRPAERMVPVASERPGAVEWIFRPACVALRRCSGCCGDEAARCEATATANVTLQVLLIRPLQDHHLEEMTFVEHTACECREPVQPLQPQPKPESRTPHHRKRKKEPGVRRERKKHGRKHLAWCNGRRKRWEPQTRSSSSPAPRPP